MSTPPNLIHLAFASGIDESVREEILDPAAAFVLLENGRQNDRGAYEKRLGYTSLSSGLIDGTTRAAGYRMFTNGDQLCVINGTHLDSRSEVLGKAVLRTRVPEATYRLRELPSDGFAIDGNTDQGDTVAVAGGDGNYIVVAREVDFSGVIYVFATVLDAENGAIVLGPSPLTTGTNMTVRLGAYGTRALLFVFDTDTDTIEMFSLDTTSSTTINAGWNDTFGGGGALLTDFGAGVGISNVSANDAVIIAYRSTGSANIKVKRVTAAGVAASVDIAEAVSSGFMLALSEGGSNLWVVWNIFSGTSVIKACALNEATLATVATTATIYTGPNATPTAIYAGAFSDGKGVAFVSYGVALTVQWTDAHRLQVLAGAAAIEGTTIALGNSRVRSRPILRSGRLYAHWSSTIEPVAECVLCDCTPADLYYVRPVASPIQRELIAAFSDRVALIPSTNKYAFAVTVRKSGTTFGALLVEYDFASPYRWMPATLNGSTFLSGGLSCLFDGIRIVETGFLSRPLTVRITDVSAAGSLTFTLGRRYVSTFEEVDGDGNWHVSGVSDPSALTGNITSKQATIKLSPIAITCRGLLNSTSRAPLRVGIWATKDGGSPPYYRLTEIENLPSSTELVYVDNTTDATLASRALLYGTGNLPGTGAGQDHRAPPGLVYHIAYNGMLVGASGNDIYFSAQPISGEGTWFSPLFSLPGDEEVVGFAVQDGSCVVFTTRGALVTSGEPPSDNGATGGLSTPRRLSVDQPCVSANSILTTSLGTFYQSSRGIELLTRGLTVQWIGEKIQDTLATYPVVSAAVLDTVDGLARFSLATTQAAGLVSGDGVDVVFDLSLGAWVSVDKKRGGSANQSTQDACIALVEGYQRYCWLATDGTVYYQRRSNEASAHLDGSTWVTLAAETASFKTGGIQGQQFLNNVLFLARKSTDHDLSVSMAYNYETSFRSARTWTRAEINALLTSGWPITQLKHSPHDDALCQAVRVRIVDATPTGGTVGTGKGASWLALTLDITPKPGIFDVPEEAA